MNTEQQGGDKVQAPEDLSVLATGIREFTQARDPIKEKQLLPGIIETIVKEVTPQNIQTLIEPRNFHLDVETLADKALQIKLAEVEGDEGEQEFTGEGAVIFISYTGNVLGYRERLQGREEGSIGKIHAEFGIGESKTLLPYALIKAVRRLHLELNKMTGGISLPANRRHLEKIGPTENEAFVYAGETTFNFTWDTGGELRSGIVIGVSGAQARKEFLARLTAGGVENPPYYLYAGLVDNLAALAIEYQCGRPHGQPAGTMVIPSEVSRLFYSM